MVAIHIPNRLCDVVVGISNGELRYVAPLLSVCSPEIGFPRSCLERKANVSSYFYECQLFILRSSFRSFCSALASGGLPHKSVARVRKGEGILLGFVVNAKHKEVANFEGGSVMSSVPASTIWGSHSK